MTMPLTNSHSLFTYPIVPPTPSSISHTSSSYTQYLTTTIMTSHWPKSLILFSCCSLLLIIIFYVYVSMIFYAFHISNESMYSRIRICPFGSCITGWRAVTDCVWSVSGKIMAPQH